MEEELKKENENLLEKRRAQRLRAKAIRKTIPGKTNTRSQSKPRKQRKQPSSMSILEQTREELKKNDLQRRIEYRKSLNEIYERVEARPCLFE